MAKITKPNVAVVEHDTSDGITITLLGQTPPHIPARHQFTGQSLRQIKATMLHLGIDVVAWMVDRYMVRMNDTDFVLIAINHDVIGAKSADKPLVFSP